MRMSSKVLGAIAVATLVTGWHVAAANTAAAQETFPSKPIEVLVPWGPGGGASTVSDIVSRIAAQHGFSAQPLTLTHKPGASGLIGTALVADRKGNPYVFMPGGGALLAQVALGESPVHPLKDLTPLALSAVDSSVVITRVDSPYKTFADVVAQLKKEPKSVTMGGAGGGPASWDGMLEVVIGAIAGVQFNQIPFESGGKVQAAVLGGQVDVGTRQLSNAEALIKAGELKALAIFDAERNPRLPNVPTMKELGYDVVLNLSRGWFAPAGISNEQLQWYADFFKKIGESPEWTEFCAQKGIQNRYLPPAEWAKFVQSGIDTIHALYTRVGIIN